MSLIDDALQANAQAAQTYDAAFGSPPTPKMVIVTCMDPRLNNILPMLGLQPGDADMIKFVAVSQVGGADQGNMRIQHIASIGRDNRYAGHSS